MKLLVSFLFIISIFSCSKESEKNQPEPDTSMYFPSDADASWERTTMSALGWNESAVQPLKDFLNQKHTKSFIILVNGRIVMEEYFNGHTPSADWEWNSAGKTLVSAAVEVAQQEGLLGINDKVSK